MPTPPPLRVFISYSNKDESYREVLETHLMGLQRQGAIQGWSHRDIDAGGDLQAAVDVNLKQADIILLLVSADFIASKDAWEKEMTQALKRQDDGEARVIPILLRPADLTGAPFARLSPLPTNAQPITLWSPQDAAWVDVTMAIRRVVEQEARQRTYPLPPNLPPPDFVGHTEEIEETVRRLQTDGVRLLTISGLFGIGKTRLASEAVRKLRRHFRDGICPVMLSRFDEQSLVASDIRAALGAPETPGQSLETSLTTFLYDKQLLLVLDRFDTARSDESLELIHGLIDATVGLKVLITSREPIPIQFGYQAQLNLPPLKTQGSSLDAGTPANTASDAARLFIAFAETKSTGIGTQLDLAVVESICSKIGGHPQTINLIAGWLTTSPLNQIEAELSEYVLLGAGEDEPSRSAWNESFQRLTADAQSVLCKLSVFRGPFSREAASAVVQTDDGKSYEVLPVFKELADRGLLQLERVANGRPTGRYWIFETIRQYAKEKLGSDQTQASQYRHATYFLKLAETAELEIEGERQVEWLGSISDDYSNIRAALRRSAKAAGYVELSLRLAGALGPYWYHRGDFTEGRVWLKELLASPEKVNPVVRAKALDLAGILASHQGDYQEAITALEEAQRLFEELDDTDATVEMLTNLHLRSKDEGVARCLKDLAWVTKERGDFDGAHTLSTQSLQLYRTGGDTWGIAQSAADLGLILLHLNKNQEAIDLLRESLDLRTAHVRQPSGLAMSRAYLGVALYRHGDRDQATQELRTSLEIAESIGFSFGIALTAYYLGLVMYATDALGESASYFLQSLRLRDHMGDRGGVAECLEGLAAVAARSGRADLASQLLARAELDRPQITGAEHSLTHVHAPIGIDIDSESIRASVESTPDLRASLRTDRTPTRPELTEAATVLATITTRVI